MRFARPELLWLLLLVPALAVWLGVSLARRRRALVRFADEAVIGRLVHAAPFGVRVVKAALLVVGAGFLILAAARPQWGSTLEQVSRRGVDVLLAIDISESMLAEDVKPNRLQRALEEASRLLGFLEGDRVGLVAFAGSAGVLCPLTLDHGAVMIFLDTLRPDMISYAGTSLAEAIRAARGGFGSEERKFKAMVLFSDGEDQIDAEDVEREAARAASEGLVIHTIGVGTTSGGPIPLRDGRGRVNGYKNDRQGRVVTTGLDEALLSRISEITAGRYYPATAAETELDRVAEVIAGMDKKQMQARLMTQYEERYQVPMAIGLAALIAEALLSDRRRPRGAGRRGRAARVEPPGAPAGRRGEAAA